MIKKYIKGNKERSSEVIKALEELGGENKTNLSGKDHNCLYYIREDGVVDVVAKSLVAGKIMQECFEEIKLSEKLNIMIKEPKQIYWFRATKDKAKNKALFDRLCDLVGINKCYMNVSDGIVYSNSLKSSITYCAEHHISSSSIECTIAMMIGKELVIEQ